MRQTFLGLKIDDKDKDTWDNHDNMTWLAEVHLPIAAAGFECAILYGNEDSPEKVELFARNHYKCKPVVAEYDEKADGLVVTKWGELPKKPGKWWSKKLIGG